MSALEAADEARRECDDCGGTRVGEVHIDREGRLVLTGWRLTGAALKAGRWGVWVTWPDGTVTYHRADNAPREVIP